ncbi:MAG: FAD:protein FMN transferase [Patescibacteria group bacterium]
MQLVTDAFHALGTTVEGGFRAEPDVARVLCGAIRQRVSDFEAKFSRFRKDSELSLLNANAGQVVVVSEELMSVLVAARDAWYMTEGIIDPTIGQALMAAGYGDSFDRLSADSEAPGSLIAPPSASFAAVELDEQNRSVVLPPGTMLDLGGIGKGYLLDRLIPLLDSVSKDYWWSLGGDIVVSGEDDDGQPWPVGVQDPLHLDKDIFQLRPLPGRWGIATSGITKRRGVRGGQPWHHIIDPRTSRPAQTEIVEVTVLAQRVLDVDVMAKTILILGEKSGLPWFGRFPEAGALLIKTDGSTIVTKRMQGLLNRL